MIFGLSWSVPGRDISDITDRSWIQNGSPVKWTVLGAQEELAGSPQHFTYPHIPYNDIPYVLGAFGKHQKKIIKRDPKNVRYFRYRIRSSLEPLLSNRDYLSQSTQNLPKVIT